MAWPICPVAPCVNAHRHLSKSPIRMTGNSLSRKPKKNVYSTLTKALNPYEDSVTQFTVFRILRGQKGRPANLSTLNDRMVSKMSNTTRLVDKLIAKGLANRNTCPENRRKVEIRLTEKGLVSLKAMDKAVDAAEKKLMGSLSEEELRQLNDLLDKV